MGLIKCSLRRLVAGVAFIGMLLPAGALWAQAPKNWKDQAEYELFESIRKGTVADQQLQLLNQWKEKYPATDFKLERAQLFLFVQNKKGDPAGLYAACKELITLDPKSFQALYFLTALTVSMNKADAEGLDVGTKAANGMIAALDETYAPAKKPPTTTEAQWKQQRNDIEVQALKTLGWVEQQKKNYKEAEKYFVKALELSPGNAEMSYFLGTVIALQKDAKRQAEALWHFARAGHLEGPGALDATRKAQVANYFSKTFIAFAGNDKKELESMIERAKASVMPPAGFEIESPEERDRKRREALKASNPMLYQFLEIKRALQAADGESYWGNLKDAELPTFKGKLVSWKPDVNPKEIVVGVEADNQRDVTIVLEKALKGKGEVGADIEFTAVAKEYTKEPFSLKLEADNEKVTGWPAVAAAPARAPVKKGAPAAKKAVKK